MSRSLTWEPLFERVPWRLARFLRVELRRLTLGFRNETLRWRFWLWSNGSESCWNCETYSDGVEKFISGDYPGPMKLELWYNDVTCFNGQVKTIAGYS
jgi:hypothetical protein